MYQKGVEANPTDPLNYIGLAKVAFFQDDNNTADEMRAKARSLLLPYKNLKKIVPPAKDYALALAKIAESYIKDGSVDTSLAFPLIREAIKIDNKNGDVYLIAGDIYILVNDGSKAISLYNQAEFADPQSPTAAMKIGNIYVKGRALNAAIPYFEQAIELNANYAPAYRELGQLYLLAQGLISQRSISRNTSILQPATFLQEPLCERPVLWKGLRRCHTTVEEIFAVDKSRVILNSIAGYSCYEKKPPDYDKALSYMETLFKTVAPEWIICERLPVHGRIFVKKNQNYPKLDDELNALELSLKKRKTNLQLLQQQLIKQNTKPVLLI